MTAVGLGFGDVVVAELMEELKISPSRTAGDCTAIGYMEDSQAATAIRLAARLRKDGAMVDLALKPEKAKAFFSRIGKNTIFRGAVYLGPDDVARGSARLKNLAARSEQEITLP